MMNSQDLKRQMVQSVGGALFMTPKELARFLGYKDPYKVKLKYLSDIAPVDKTRYYIPEIVPKITSHVCKSEY